MKKIFVLILVFLVSGALLYRCDEIETGFDKLSNPADPASNEYYVQFINPLKTYETGVTESGALVEVEKPISITLMGVPQDEAIILTLTRDPSSTMATNMYTLSANSITIPAGKTSGSVTFKTVAANMTPGQTVKLVLTINAGEHNSPNVNALKLTYNVKRMLFCPIVVSSLVGSYTGTDGYGTGGTLLPSQVAMSNPSGSIIKVTGLNYGWIASEWLETVTSGGTIDMTVGAVGSVTIPYQYCFTTTYGGKPYEYWIQGSGTWSNCGASPSLIINYTLKNVTDDYVLPGAYDSGYSQFTATITKSLTKGTTISETINSSESKISAIKALKEKLSTR